MLKQLFKFIHVLQKYKRQKFSLKVSCLLLEVEDFQKDRSMARFNLDLLTNVTDTNQLPLKIFHSSQAGTLTGSTERLSAMLKCNNTFLHWHATCKTLMQILQLLTPLHISVHNLAIPVPNLATPERTQEKCLQAGPKSLCFIRTKTMGFSQQSKSAVAI